MKKYESRTATALSCTGKVHLWETRESFVYQWPYVNRARGENAGVPEENTWVIMK